MTKQTLSLWENGKATPSWSKLHRMTQVLGIQMWQLVRAAELTIWKRDVVRVAVGGDSAARPNN